uniref:Uncharacterized protein n=1 Tax=Arundo donax TaxID=35708 RepID=A0A0A9B565_ARUDO
MATQATLVTRDFASSSAPTAKDSNDSLATLSLLSFTYSPIAALIIFSHGSLSPPAAHEGNQESRTASSTAAEPPCPMYDDSMHASHHQRQSQYPSESCQMRPATVVGTKRWRPRSATQGPRSGSFR